MKRKIDAADDAAGNGKTKGAPPPKRSRRFESLPPSSMTTRGAKSREASTSVSASTTGSVTDSATASASASVNGGSRQASVIQPNVDVKNPIADSTITSLIGESRQSSITQPDVDARERTSVSASSSYSRESPRPLIEEPSIDRNGLAAKASHSVEYSCEPPTKRKRSQETDEVEDVGTLPGDSETDAPLAKRKRCAEQGQIDNPGSDHDDGEEENDNVGTKVYGVGRGRGRGRGRGGARGGARGRGGLRGRGVGRGRGGTRGRGGAAPLVERPVDNLDTHTAADSRRQEDLKRAFRATSKNLKTALVELAERTQHAVENDPLAHTKSENFKVVKATLDARLAENLSSEERVLQFKLNYARKKFEMDEALVKMQYQHDVEEKRELFDAVLKHKYINLVARNGEEQDGNMTDDEDGFEMIMREDGSLRDQSSRCRYLIEVDSRWNKLLRKGLGGALGEGRFTTTGGLPEAFVTFDSGFRQGTIASQNLETVTSASDVVNDLPVDTRSPSTVSASWVRLQALASVAEEAAEISKSSASYSWLMTPPGMQTVGANIARKKRELAAAKESGAASSPSSAGHSIEDPRARPSSIRKHHRKAYFGVNFPGSTFAQQESRSLPPLAAKPLPSPVGRTRSSASNVGSGPSTGLLQHSASSPSRTEELPFVPPSYLNDSVSSASASQPLELQGSLGHYQEHGEIHNMHQPIHEQYRGHRAPHEGHSMLPGQMTMPSSSWNNAPERHHSNPWANNGQPLLLHTVPGIPPPPSRQRELRPAQTAFPPLTHNQQYAVGPYAGRPDPYGQQTQSNHLQQHDPYLPTPQPPYGSPPTYSMDPYYYQQPTLSYQGIQNPSRPTHGLMPPPPPPLRPAPSQQPHFHHYHPQPYYQQHQRQPPPP